MQKKSSKNPKIYRPQFGIPTARGHPWKKCCCEFAYLLPEL